MIHANRGLAVAAALALLAAGPQGARADRIVDVNFTGSSALGSATTAGGAAAVGSAGDTWNGVFAGTVSGPGTGSGIALVDATGASTGVTLGFAGLGGYHTGPSPSPNPTLTEQYLFGRASITVTLGGLVAGQGYDLYVYSQGELSDSSRAIDLTANGVGPVAVTALGTATTFTAGVNYAPFVGLRADSLGRISIVGVDDVLNTSGEIDINGFQLVTAATVPEPSSVAPLGAGAVGLVGSAWRRRRRGSARP